MLASDVRRAAVDVKRSADVKSSAADDMIAFGFSTAIKLLARRGGAKCCGGALRRVAG